MFIVIGRVIRVKVFVSNTFVLRETIYIVHLTLLVVKGLATMLLLHHVLVLAYIRWILFIPQLSLSVLVVAWPYVTSLIECLLTYASISYHHIIIPHMLPIFIHILLISLFFHQVLVKVMMPSIHPLAPFIQALFVI